jgi:hypothetical protein
MELVVPGPHASAPLGSARRLRSARSCSSARGATCCCSDPPPARRCETDRDLGGIARQYLNHRHEASDECDWVLATFHAPLYCHTADAGQVAERCHVALDVLRSPRR